MEGSSSARIFLRVDPWKGGPTNYIAMHVRAHANSTTPVQGQQCPLKYNEKRSQQIICVIFEKLTENALCSGQYVR
jgi:hypothetical protein